MSALLLLVPAAEVEADADFEVDADADFEVDADADFDFDGLVLLDVPAAGDDFGLPELLVAGLTCWDPAFWAQLVLDGDAAGLADLDAFGLPDAVADAVAVAVEVSVALGELDPDALAVPVDGLTGGLVLALAEAPVLVVAGGVVLTAGLLVFGDVRGDEVGDFDAAGQEGAAAAWLDAVVAPTALLLLAPAAAEAAWPDVPWPDAALLPLLVCPVNTEELSCTTACRSGGTAIATPIANSAHTAASAGRSIASRMSQPLHQLERARRERVRDLRGRLPAGPDRSVRPAGPELPGGPAEGPRSRPYSGPGALRGKAPGAVPGKAACPESGDPGTGPGDPGTGPGSGPGAGMAAALALAPANDGPPARILARIRSRPSARGST